MSDVGSYSELDGFKSIYHDAYRGKHDGSSLREEGILIKENGDGKYEIKFSLLNAEERQILREKNIDINNETTWVSLSFSATQPEYAVLLAKAKKKEFEAQIGTIRKTDSEAIDTLKERFVKEIESRTKRSENTLQTVGFLKAVHDTETGGIKLVSLANSDDVLEIKRQHHDELPKRFAERLETLLEVSQLAKEKISEGARNWGKSNISELAQKVYKQTNNTVAYLGFTDENGASHRRLVDILAAILKEEESANKSSPTVTLNNEKNVGAKVTLTPTDHEQQAKETNNRLEGADTNNPQNNNISENSKNVAQSEATTLEQPIDLHDLKNKVEQKFFNPQSGYKRAIGFTLLNDIRSTQRLPEGKQRNEKIAELELDKRIQDYLRDGTAHSAKTTEQVTKNETPQPQNPINTLNKTNGIEVHSSSANASTKSAGKIRSEVGSVSQQAINLFDLENKIKEKLEKSQSVVDKVVGYNILNRIKVGGLSEKELKELNEKIQDYLKISSNIKSDTSIDSKSLLTAVEELKSLVNNNVGKGGVLEQVKKFEFLEGIDNIKNFTDLEKIATGFFQYIGELQDPKA